jgi:hypothetical protein
MQICLLLHTTSTDAFDCLTNDAFDCLSSDAIYIFGSDAFYFSGSDACHFGSEPFYFSGRDAFHLGSSTFYFLSNDVRKQRLRPKFLQNIQVNSYVRHSVEHTSSKLCDYASIIHIKFS